MQDVSWDAGWLVRGKRERLEKCFPSPSPQDRDQVQVMLWWFQTGGHTHASVNTSIQAWQEEGRESSDFQTEGTCVEDLSCAVDPKSYISFGMLLSTTSSRELSSPPLILLLILHLKKSVSFYFYFSSSSKVALHGKLYKKTNKKLHRYSENNRHI